MRWLEATATAEMQVPQEELFAWVADIQNMPEWVVGVSEPQATSTGDWGVGSTFTSKYTYRNKTFDIAYTVTAFDPPRHYAMASDESGPFPFQGALRLSPGARGGTEVANTIRAGSDSWMTSVMFTVGAPFLRWMMRRQLGKELQELKQRLETA